MNYLFEYEKAHNYFYYDDVFSALVGTVLTEREFLLGWINLLPYKHFELIQSTIKLYAFKDKQLDYEEIVRKKFLVDNYGHRIGFYSSLKFLKDIGVDNIDIKTINLFSNALYGQKHIVIYLNQVCYNIAPPHHGLINDENYAYQQVLTWLGSGKVTFVKEILFPLSEFIKDNQLTREGFEKESKSFSRNTTYRLERLYKEFTNYGIHV